MSMSTIMLLTAIISMSIQTQNFLNCYTLLLTTTNLLTLVTSPYDRKTLHDICYCDVFYCCFWWCSCTDHYSPLKILTIICEGMSHMDNMWQNWYRTVCMSHIEYRYIEAKNQIAYTYTIEVYQSIDVPVLPQEIMALTWCQASRPRQTTTLKGLEILN